MTNHLSDDDLILHQFGETTPGDQARVAAHLSACDACRSAHDQLGRVLTLVGTAPPVEARPGFERDVWARLEPKLEAREEGWRRWFWMPQWALAGGVAALVMVAFMAGRLSSVPPPAELEPLQAVNLTERVLRAAVGDHLDSTQMMLVELVNSDATEPGSVATEQARAADLVAVSRVIRMSAARSGDVAIVDMLEDIERVLIEIANAPADATSNEMSDVKARITTEDLIFRVRVIASELRQQNRIDREAGDRTPRRLPTS
mgnify:CR=1 FL=1